jgi:serine/threonine-protein kinase
VLTALAKLPADRFASAGEFAAALANPAATMPRAGVPPALARDRRGWLITAAVGAAALVAGLMLGGRRASDSGSVRATDMVHASFALGDSAAVRAIGNLRLAISPNGRRIVYVGVDGASSSLWLREFDQRVPRRLQDTKDAFAPFFSPDGESIGFFTLAGSGRGAALKVTSLAGGVTRTVVQDSVAPYGGADWGDDGQIYFTNAARGLARVTSSGGVITKLSHPDTAHSDLEHDYPDVLPGSRLAIVGVWKGSTSGNRIGVVDLRTGVVTDLMAGTFARYTSGYLAVGTAEEGPCRAIFISSGRLISPVQCCRIAEMEANNGTVQFAVSNPVSSSITDDRRGSVARLGRRSSRQAPADNTLTDVSTFAVTRGTEIALARSGSGDNRVWVKKLTTGSLSRLSFDVVNADSPAWMPDGRRVASSACATDDAPRGCVAPTG